MRFTLDPGGDVVVPDGVTLGHCRDGLARLAGRPDLRAAALTVDGRVLPDDHVAGAPPWVAGAVLSRTAGADAVTTAPRHVDSCEAAARAPWHLAVVAGPTTGEVHAPGTTGATVDLRAVAASGPVVTHRAAGRVRGRRWWVRTGTGRPRRLRPGDRVPLGPSTLELRLGSDEPTPSSTWRRRLGGRRRSAARGDGAPGPVLAARGRALRTAVLQPGVVVPLVGSVVLAVVLRSPAFLVMGLVGPLAVLLQRREDDGARARGAGAAGATDRPPADRVRSAGPVGPPAPGSALTDPAAAAVRAARERIVLGTSTGTDTGTSTGTSTGTDAADRYLVDGTLSGTRRTGRPVERAPWWPFAADGGLAVVGPADHVAGVVRALLADAVADRSLPLAALLPPGPGWAWLRWAGARLSGGPGARVARTAAQTTAVLAGCEGRVLVLDAYGTARRPALHRWWVDRRAPRAALLLVEEHASDLPAWCPWVLEVSRGGDDAVLRGSDGAAVTVQVGHVGEDWAERHARRCAAGPCYPADGSATAAPGPGRVRAVTADDELPALVGLADIGLPTDRAAVGRAWTMPRPRRALALPVGADGRGTVHVDLVRDGPHLLIAGTTGAGKSELLQSLLLSLALTHPPDEVAMVLLDYKGGAGFGRTRDLPHVAGMVTDLEPAAAARALEGLRTELRRREELLAAADVTDLAELPRPPARLLVVVDEFRALVEDLPEFVPALVRLATQGRSLGVHLVLATQRPSGVVDAQLRANLPLRVCLRVTDPADSLDVVEVPDAAAITAATPGRAVLSRPGAGTDLVQTAWAALPPLPDALPAGPVRAADPFSTWSPWRRPDAPVRGPRHGEPSAEVVDALVGEVAAAHRAAGGHRAAPPWLPPLPAVVGHDELHDLEGLGPVPGSDAALPLVVRDLPDRRARDVVGWDRRGHLAVVGGARSGRTTTLRAVAAGALAGGSAVHVVTAGSAEVWRTLAGHPGLGTVVGPDDPARVLTLLTTLLRPVVPAASGAGDADLGADGGRRTIEGSATVLCIDDAAGVVRSLDLLPRAPGAELLDRVLRDARACGVAVAVSALPGEAHGLLRHVTERLVLRVDDVHDALALGVPRTLWSAGGPPGRGVHLPPAGGAAHPPRLCQVVLPARPPHPARPDPCRPEALRIVPLPPVVRLADVASPSGVPPSLVTAQAPPPLGAAPRDHVALGPLLGVGGDDARPVRLPLQPAVVVVGPPSSGRSTTLRTVVQGLRRAGHPVHDDPADVLAVIGAHGHAGTAPPLDAARVRAPAVVVVDDVELLLRRRPAVEEVLTSWVEAAEEGRPGVPCVVVAARTDRVASAYRGLLALLRASATLVVLAPGSAGSADVAGCDLAPALYPLHPRRPGRGALVVAGQVTRVQVALA
ncbi:FtsK/SpoIIIE domain-containing protein [Actinotalea sp. Marseille-Q4924]|uniref:FtsK/SpoIIIE domain-containing protein n=1 Tax=Actinotalea sp. Marseille-Q4924 TaxID=2866571 RepID=UPI001CE402B6|nr:FtsK/SpoIIIE domain-containing protein [Actinotalea sp. Marseille-Q4924]